MKRIFTDKPVFSILMTIWLISGSAGIFSACDSDDVGNNLYTSTDETMGEYLVNHPERYSEFVRLLDTAGVLNLLYTYGEYTCFAPDNEAMKAFYQSQNKRDLSDYSMDTLQMMAKDHIINGAVVKYADFIEGRLSQLSMSGRYFTISFESTGETYVNKTSLITMKDILVHNGVIHQISEVLNPSRDGIVDAIAKDSSFTLFYTALIQTGLADSLLKVEDKSYDPNNYKSLIEKTKDAGDWYYDDIPWSRKFGYTVFMESDATFHKNGIDNLEDLKRYAAEVYDAVYPEDKAIQDITNRHNSLNRFIAYHLVNKQMSARQLIDAYATEHMLTTMNMYEYIETMCPNTLIEVTKAPQLGITNQLNWIKESGRVIQLVSGHYDNSALNGVYHEIDGMLVYDAEFANYISTKRLRFDAASFFPELTNNNMRGSGTEYTYKTQNLHYKIPRGYIDRITSSEQTVVGYLHPYYKYQDYEGDEIFLNASSGKLYDFTITTPPIPKGIYEVRFGYLTNGKRGVAQLYIDGMPAGVPLNLNKYATDASIGWVEPHTDASDYEGYENDKMMRNRGYMKAPACFKVPTTGWTYGENARFSSAALRKILGIYDFKTDTTHLLMVKGLSSGEFMFDYMEFVPTSVLESEDIY
jgi:uncharacterized surface protein with fasciclin (FAS1) repeats